MDSTRENDDSMISIVSVCWLGLAHFIGSLTITFLSPAQTAFRYGSLLLIIPCLFLAFDDAGDSFLAELYTMYIVGYGIHAHYFLCLLRVAAPERKEGTDKELPLFQRWLWACQSLFTPRREIAAPQSSAAESKGHFLSRHLWNALWSTFLYLALQNVQVLPLVLRGLANFSPGKESVIMSVSAGEATLDDWMTWTYITIHGILTSYVILSGAHSACALISVALVPESQTEWQTPLFGPLSSAYSLRRWYATFWHKLMRKGFTSNAAWFTHECLRIPRGTLAARIAILIVCFAISGVMHTVASWSKGSLCNNWLPLWYNIAFALSIIAEDIVRRIYVGLMHMLNLKRGKWVRVAERSFGYLWVALWLIEAVARSRFPGIRCALGL